VKQKAGGEVCEVVEVAEELEKSWFLWEIAASVYEGILLVMIIPLIVSWCFESDFCRH
jgi:MFS-type transporter involved in bile tolerance (Atg22 family)